MPNKASSQGLKLMAVVSIHEIILLCIWSMGETQLTHSPCSLSLSLLSVRSGWEVSFWRGKESFSVCCGFLIASLSWKEGCPGLLSRGDQVPVHYHRLVHFLSYKQSMVRGLRQGPVVAKLDQRVGVIGGLPL